MVDVKMNKKSDKQYAKDLWKCDYCLSLDSQSHIIWCPASLRVDKNLHDYLDLVQYIQAIMRIRNGL